MLDRIPFKRIAASVGDSWLLDKMRGDSGNQAGITHETHAAAAVVR